MAKEEKVVTPAVVAAASVEVPADESKSDLQARWDAFCAAYEKQSPANYALRRADGGLPKDAPGWDARTLSWVI